MGAELCARWYLLFKGDLGSLKADRFIAYSSEAQDVFSWMLAGKAATSLAGRVSKGKFNAETAADFSEALAESAACADTIFNKIFNTTEPRLTTLKVAGDTIGDLLDLKSFIANPSLSAGFGAIKGLASFFQTLLSAGAAYGIHAYVMPRVSLVLDTTVFISKFVQFNLEKK